MVPDEPTDDVDAELAAARVAVFAGLAEWQWEAARRRGMLPEAGEEWNATAVAARVEAILAAVGDQRPYGAWRAAQRLSEALGMDVQADDVAMLADAGQLAIAGEYKGHTLYDVAQLSEVTAEQVTACRATRPLTDREAAAMLDMTVPQLHQACQVRNVEPLPSGRWARCDIAALADDADLADAIESGRTLGPQQAATYLEIRPSDFRYLTDGGYIRAVAHVPRDAGRRSTVMVPLYRIADLDALRDHPDIPWPALQGLAPRTPSPLREVIQRKPDRAVSVRRFAAEVADRWPGIEVWTTYQRGGAMWRLDWTRQAGAPTADDVAALMAADPVMAGHAGSIKLGTDQGHAILHARRLTGEPGYGVVLDFETTDLYGLPVEIGIVDGVTGETLYQSLVRPPAGVEISEGAHACHGLSLADLADAPEWPTVVPHVWAVLAGRECIAAYNARFDHRIYRKACEYYGIDPGPVGDPKRWWCAMEARNDYDQQRWSVPLGGSHRAIGDCQAALDVIRGMTRLPRNADLFTTTPTKETAA